MESKSVLATCFLANHTHRLTVSSFVNRCWSGSLCWPYGCSSSPSSNLSVSHPNLVLNLETLDGGQRPKVVLHVWGWSCRVDYEAVGCLHFHSGLEEGAVAQRSSELQPLAIEFDLCVVGLEILTSDLHQWRMHDTAWAVLMLSTMSGQ